MGTTSWRRTAIGLASVILFGLPHGVLAQDSTVAIPDPPPPCPDSLDSEPVAALIQQIKAVDPNRTETDYAALCASNALAHKGESIIPDMLVLLETRQISQEMYALNAIASLRTSGAKAVPYLVERLRAGPPDTFAEWTYHTLSWIGAGARPAIPFLIGKSWSTVEGDFSESEVALETLAELAQYEPEPIVANLVRLLDDPRHVLVAAKTLQKMGALAKPAAQPLREHLLRAVSTGKDAVAGALIATLDALDEKEPSIAPLAQLLDRPRTTLSAAKALEEIGPDAKAAVPALLARLQVPHLGPEGHKRILAALTAIDESSPVIMKLNISAATERKNWPDEYERASRLARVDPFPKDLAPALKAAIAKLPDDDRITGRLEEALRHAGAGAQLVAAAPSTPIDVGARLAPGLLQLNGQLHALTERGVVTQFGLAQQDYVEVNGPLYVALTAKRDWARSTSGASPVFSISASGVRRRLFLSSGDPDVYEQTVEIRLASGACISMPAIEAVIRARQPARAADPMQTIAVVGHHVPSTQLESLEITHDRSASESDARKSQLWVGPGCGTSVKIWKSFGEGYWKSVCPFHPDDRFVQRVVIPGVRKLLGAELEAYDTNSLEWNDFGQPTIQFSYDELRRPGRVWLALDRCSYRVSLISKGSQ